MASQYPTRSSGESDFSSESSVDRAFEMFLANSGHVFHRRRMAIPNQDSSQSFSSSNSSFPVPWMNPSAPALPDLSNVLLPASNTQTSQTETQVAPSYNFGSSPASAPLAHLDAPAPVPATPQWRVQRPSFERVDPGYSRFSRNPPPFRSPYFSDPHAMDRQRVDIGNASQLMSSTRGNSPHRTLPSSNPAANYDPSLLNPQSSPYRDPDHSYWSTNSNLAVGGDAQRPEVEEQRSLEVEEMAGGWERVVRFFKRPVSRTRTALARSSGSRPPSRSPSCQTLGPARSTSQYPAGASTPARQLSPSPVVIGRTASPSQRPSPTVSRIATASQPPSPVPSSSTSGSFPPSALGSTSSSHLQPSYIGHDCHDHSSRQPRYDISTHCPASDDGRHFYAVLVAQTIGVECRVCRAVQEIVNAASAAELLAIVQLLNAGLTSLEIYQRLRGSGPI